MSVNRNCCVLVMVTAGPETWFVPLAAHLNLGIVLEEVNKKKEAEKVSVFLYMLIKVIKW